MIICLLGVMTEKDIHYAHFFLKHSDPCVSVRLGLNLLENVYTNAWGI